MQNNVKPIARCPCPNYIHPILYPIVFPIQYIHGASWCFLYLFIYIHIKKICQSHINIDIKYISPNDINIDIPTCLCICIYIYAIICVYIIHCILSAIRRLQAGLRSHRPQRQRLPEHVPCRGCRAMARHGAPCSTQAA